MNDEVNDFLFGSGAKAFQFEKIGDTCMGEIVSAELRQQTHAESGDLLFWTDGRPRMQLVIVLQTKERSDDDDGLRTIYAKGGKHDIAEGEGQSMRDAIADAVKEAGGKGLFPGDQLAVVYTGVGTKKKGLNPPKLYTAGYKKAVASVAANDLFGDGD